MAADDRDLNRDPLTDEPGAHPVATGLGATGGAVAGAAAGMVGGPLGAAVGGVVGAVVGGLAGRAAGEAVNPTDEEAHWRDNYTNEPYYEAGRSFDDYGPAYRHGLEARTRYEDEWDIAEPKLASEWETARAGSSLSWHQARPASRAAWDRVETLRSARTGGSDANLTHYGTGLSGTDSTLHTGGGTNANDASLSGVGVSGAAAAVGSAQSAGDNSGDKDDVLDVLNNLIECCRDGEYGFRECAEQAQRQDLKTLFNLRAQDCSRGAQELQELVRDCGGTPEDSGSMLGSVHRGWVSMKASLSTYDDKAVLEEAERGEDNALARYRKALQKNLPQQVRDVVQRQCDGVQRNHDQVKMLRDQTRDNA